MNRTKIVYLVCYPDDDRTYVSSWEPEPTRRAHIESQGGAVYPYILPIPPDPVLMAMLNTVDDEEDEADELEAQRRSFAYGNCAIENPRVTRELIDRVADEMAAAALDDEEGFGD